MSDDLEMLMFRIDTQQLSNFRNGLAANTQRGNSLQGKRTQGIIGTSSTSNSKRRNQMKTHTPAAWLATVMLLWAVGTPIVKGG